MELITVTEAASRLGVRREAIYYSIRQGKLTAHRDFGRVLVEAEQVAAYRPRRDIKRKTLRGRGYLAGRQGSVDEFIARKAAEKAMER